MNKKTLEVFGYKKLEDVVGRKCYEVFQNSLTPCSICNNSTLKAGEFQEWNYYNPVLKRHFMLKDTMVEEEGRRYRIEMALDVTTQEKQRDTIHHFEDMETIVNEGIRIALQAKTPDKSIDVILEYLGKALHGERTYILKRDRMAVMTIPMNGWQMLLSQQDMFTDRTEHHMLMTLWLKRSKECIRTNWLTMRKWELK